MEDCIKRETNMAERLGGMKVLGARQPGGRARHQHQGGTDEGSYT